ncbi:MAG: oxalurate catabolism protein HpxZ [Steroidobacteraceae bacterium]
MTLSSGQVNEVDVLFEVRAVFARYEAALVANDVAALNAFFWTSAHTVRYGLAEHGYGINSIAAQRAALTPVHPERRLGKLVITTLGADLASVAAEFSAPDSPRIGRQTQVWARFAEGWRIVAAHVSTVEPGVARSCDSG